MGGNSFRDNLQIFVSSLEKNPRKVLFSDLIEKASSFLHVTPDTEYALKVSCGAVTANYLDEDPVWIMITAPPSSAKTEIIQSFGECPFANNISSITARTLASGERNNPQASLLKRIGAFGMILLKDMTSLLELNPLERAEIFSQLREVYDGAYAKTFGNGVVVDWKGKIAVLGGCTPIIEKYSDTFKTLGERFLGCRISDVTGENQESVLNKAFDDQPDSVRLLRGELRAVVRDFIQERLRSALVTKIVLSQDEKRVIKTCAKFIAQTRAGVVRDSYHRDDILVKPFQEGAARVLKQLKSLLKGLCLVDDTETPSRAHLACIIKIALDNIPSLRKEILMSIPGQGMYRADLNRLLGYDDNSRHFRRMIEDLTKLEILKEVKKDNRVRISPSDTVKEFYAIYNEFCTESAENTVFSTYSTENITKNSSCPEKHPPPDSEALEAPPDGGVDLGTACNTEALNSGDGEPPFSFPKETDAAPHCESCDCEECLGTPPETLREAGSTDREDWKRE